MKDSVGIRLPLMLYLCILLAQVVHCSLTRVQKEAWTSTLILETGRLIYVFKLTSAKNF